MEIIIISTRNWAKEEQYNEFAFMEKKFFFMEMEIMLSRLSHEKK